MSSQSTPRPDETRHDIDFDTINDPDPERNEPDMHDQMTQPDPIAAPDDLVRLDSFFAEGLLAEVLYEVKSGKEATVYCCRPGRELKGECDLVAAKVYRPIEERAFRNDAIYQEGRMARNTRFRRAVINKSEFGRQVQYALWRHHEWETLATLYQAGVNTPRPIAQNDEAILMSFFGDAEAAAPRLHEADLTRDEVSGVLDAMWWDIETMLDVHRVHGDLSPYNVLWSDGSPVIIDFPQAVDPRMNSMAYALLRRDIERMADWGRSRGVDSDHDALIERLWSAFVVGDIG